MKKKITVKPSRPNPKCCKTCLVQAACSIVEWSDCPDAWAEIMEVGSYVYWPTVSSTTKKGLIEEGYSEEDADLISKIPDIMHDIRKGKLTIRPATKRDRNVVKFVITEYS